MSYIFFSVLRQIYISVKLGYFGIWCSVSTILNQDVPHISVDLVLLMYLCFRRINFTMLYSKVVKQTITYYLFNKVAETLERLNSPGISDLNTKIATYNYS